MSGTAPAASSHPDPGHRGRLAVAVARAVDSVPDARRSGGIGIPVATQHAGGRVIGVALSDDHVNVHIVAQRMDVVNIANSVHEAVGRVLRHAGDLRRLSVVVDDLDLCGTL